jgi:hypothetical protein
MNGDFGVKPFWKRAAESVPGTNRFRARAALGDEVDGGASRGRDSTAQGALALGWVADKFRKPQRGEIPFSMRSLFCNWNLAPSGLRRHLNRYPGLDALGYRIVPLQG